MTKSEESAIQELSKIGNDIRNGFSSFKKSAEERIDELEKRVLKKTDPLYFEKDILSTAQNAINESIKAVLTGYNGPLTKLVLSVVDNHSTELSTIINDAFVTVIKTDEFKESIISAFSHKVSRAIISNNEGLFDKVSNELKQDNQFKARMTLAVAAVVEECLKSKKEN